LERKAISSAAGNWPQRGICFVARRLQYGNAAWRAAPRIRRALENRKIRVHGREVLKRGSPRVNGEQAQMTV